MTKMKLSDFKNLGDGYTLEADIWYVRSSKFREFIDGKGEPNRYTLGHTHVPLGRINIKPPLKDSYQEYADNIYSRMQGENWSPNGEANKFIEGFGDLGHTSMSIGDIIHFKNGPMLMCEPTGWRIL